jgi:hypothetical protein
MVDAQGTSVVPPPPVQLARLLDGYLVTQLLYVAARLGIADELTAGPRSGSALAAAVGADAGALTRALRRLVIEGVFAEDAEGQFVLTPLGECLRSGVDGSLRDAVLARGDVYYQAAAGMLRTVMEGGVAFEHVHGMPFFDHLAAHPNLEAAFQGSMADRSRQEASAVVAAYDFGGFQQLVDVGGGSGLLLEAILRAAPRLRGVLLDRPTGVERARRRMEAAGLAGRCDCVVGDFFAAVPAGADAYLLSRVLHDWDDAEATRILATCRAAMAPGSRLLIVEAVMPERALDGPAAVRMDLNMLMLLGGRERTAAEYATLLTAAGLQFGRVVPTRAAAGLSIIEASRGGE